MSHLHSIAAGFKLAGIISGTSLVAIETFADEPSLLRYAITQGGLLAVVLVLLWSYRRDQVSIIAQRGDYIKVLTDLVQQATAAQAHSAASQTAMADAIKEMSRTVGHISQRRND